MSPINYIDKIFYINLPQRTDRRARVEKTLSIFPKDKIERFEAIINIDGAIGCLQSHIRVLDLAISRSYNNYLVIEDDAVWNEETKKSWELLLNLLHNPYDVIMLGTVFAKHTDDFRLLSGQTSTGYIVSNSYFSRLKQNFTESLDGLIKTGNSSVYALDQYWKRLQEKDNWRCVIPSLLIQSPDFSNIENKVVDYTHLFS